jgi:hypothetical protein
MFFFEKKNQKTSPGCFARSRNIELNLQRRRHSNARMPVALSAWRRPRAHSKPRSAFKSFLILFFKKEPLSSSLAFSNWISS